MGKDRVATSGCQYRAYHCSRCGSGKTGDLREVNGWIRRHARFCDLLDDQERKNMTEASNKTKILTTNRSDLVKKSKKGTNLLEIPGATTSDDIRCPTLPSTTPSTTPMMTDEELIRLLMGTRL